MAKKNQRKRKERSVRRIHFWVPGQYPGDPDADDPNVHYVNLGKLAEEDAAAEPKSPLWTPHGGPESGMDCPNCGGPTYIVDEKTVTEILEPFGYQSDDPPEEKIVALGCPKCNRPVMQMRESALPRR